MKRSRTIIAVTIAGLISLSMPAPASAANAFDYQAGRIIDDAVFNNAGAMTLDQVQSFLNAKVPVCDNWGTKPYGGTTRRAYLEGRGVKFPLTCLKDYAENPTTHENNLEGRGVPAGAMSAAHIIWDAGQRYGINPQVLIVLLQKEQGIVADDWPEPYQFTHATGYGCPDTAPCDVQYYGFYNQVQRAAWQFRHYANNPNSFNHVPYQNNFVRYNPNSACGGSVVYIQNQATASLYNYTPYQPNNAALAAGYGGGDGCSAHGNRNFFLYFSDWFGNPLFNDPFGWDVIKTENDGRWWMVVGKTKRYIPSSALYYDWDLDKKPVRTATQAEFDSYETLPDLERLGWFGDRYYYIDGGKKYWLSTDQLLKAWGQYFKRGHAAAAFSLIASMPDGGEGTFYVAQASEGKIAFLDDGKRYSFPTADADRWRANPVQLTSDAYNGIAQAATLDYHVSINGLKFIVDNGRLLDVTNPIVLRAFGKTNATFVNIPGSVSVFMRSELAWPTIVQEGTPHWYRLLGGKKYHLLIEAIAKTWGGDKPTVVSAKLFDSFTTNASALAAIVREPDSDTYYLIDNNTKHKLTGVMRESLFGGGITYPEVDATSLADLPNAADISSPILRNRDHGHIYTIVNGYTYHIPNLSVLNAYGVPRKYQPADVGANATYSISPNFVPVNMFLVNSGTTYFMQDGYAFPVASGAVADWTGGATPKSYLASNFTTRFNVLSTPITQKFNELGRNMIASNGALVDVGQYNDAYDNGSAWPGMVAFGMPRVAGGSYIARSSDQSDGRLWLISKGQKYYIANMDQLRAYSKNFTVPETVLSPTALALFSTGSGNPSLLTVSQNNGFKLFEQDGTYFSFPNGDTAVNFMNNNRLENLADSIAGSWNREKSTITRLIRSPDGRVFWVENGQKRWILSLAKLQQYEAGTRMTDVSHGVANWLPDGAVIQ